MGKVVSIAKSGSQYDLAAEELRRKFEAEACMLIVLSGHQGTGVSMSMPDDLREHIPGLFREIAQEWEDALIMERLALRCPVCAAGLSFDPQRQRIPLTETPPGSLTVCANCASFIMLDTSETWRVLSEQELAELPDAVRIALSRARRRIEREQH